MSPSLLQLTFIWFVPESPRWLVSKGRKEEALAILVKYHAEGDANSAFVAAEFSEIETAIEAEMQAKKSRWVDLFLSPGNRKRVLIAACVGLFSQWSGNGLVSYYLAQVLKTIGITDKRVQNEINLGLQCWNLVSGVAGAFITSVSGRRPQYLISYACMLIAFICWTGASADFAQTANNSAATAVVALIFIYYWAYNTMMPLTYMYIAEVFPFMLRAKGVAITQTFSRAGSAFNQFVNPIGLGNLGWKFYIVYDVWLACELLIIVIFYPETKGPTLEELAFLFDGPQAQIVDTFDPALEKGARTPSSEEDKSEVAHVEK